MNQLETWLTWIMIGTALAGTILYLRVELANSDSLSSVGWSIIIAVWFVVLRRLFHRRR